MNTNELKTTRVTPVVPFGDWPVITLEKNPLSPDDGCLEVASTRADYVATHRGYTIVANSRLKAGVVYRPDGTPLLVRGKWLVVVDKETAEFCVDLDAYWCSQQSAAPTTTHTNAA